MGGSVRMVRGEGLRATSKQPEAFREMHMSKICAGLSEGTGVGEIGQGLESGLTVTVRLPNGFP